MTTNRFNCAGCGALITPQVKRYQVRRVEAGHATQFATLEAYICPSCWDDWRIQIRAGQMSKRLEDLRALS